MFQEIAPYVYDNTYHNEKGRTGDLAVYVKDRAITLERNGNTIAFPKLREEDIPDSTYLFSIGEEHFFLVKEDPAAYDGRYVPVKNRELTPLQPKQYAFAASVAVQLASWYEDNRYCGRCGKPNLRSAKERMLYCPDCHTAIYPRLNPVVIVGVLHDDKILLTRNLSYKNHYALVSGFAEIGETIEETVRREVHEEVGLEVKNIRFYRSQPWPMSDSLLFGFFCDLDGDDHITVQEDELAEAVWRRRDEIGERDPHSLTSEMITLFREGKI